MHIRLDSPLNDLPAALLREHLRDVASHSPPESIHALAVDALCGPKVTFWTAWDADDLLGCGALLELSCRNGEIKSMRTAHAHLRRGVASAILRHIINEAHDRRYARLSLETGVQDAFAPARALYARHGFTPCGPFGGYTNDPNSVFMTLGLG